MFKLLLSKLREKPLQTSLQYHPKPVLKVQSTMVPQSFLNKFGHWDGHLFNNQTVFED
jgi:hypothetical protein